MAGSPPRGLPPVNSAADVRPAPGRAGRNATCPAERSAAGGPLADAFFTAKLPSDRLGYPPLVLLYGYGPLVLAVEPALRLAMLFRERSPTDVGFLTEEFLKADFLGAALSTAWLTCGGVLLLRRQAWGRNLLVFMLTVTFLSNCEDIATLDGARVQVPWPQIATAVLPMAVAMPLYTRVIHHWVGLSDVNWRSVALVWVVVAIYGVLLAR